MTDTIEITPFDANKWVYVKTPLPDMPRFVTHSVVSDDGGRLELGNYRPENEPITSIPFRFSAPELDRVVRFEIGVRFFNHAGGGRGMDPSALFYLQELDALSGDLALLQRVAQAVRALLSAMSDGHWDIERLQLVRGWNDV
ncbi:MAG: hypothetical protein ABL879_19940 [Devosia sp.]